MPSISVYARDYTWNTPESNYQEEVIDQDVEALWYFNPREERELNLDKLPAIQDMLRKMQRKDYWPC